jgi:hypothetical protein
MPQDSTTPTTPSTGGLNERAFEPARDGELSGTGGSDGGGTIAGSGDPSGAATDRNHPGDEPDAIPRAALGELAGRSGSEEAAEAAALGSADGALADAAGVGGPGGRTLGETPGGGAGRDIGSGTPGDRGELGGGDPIRD